MVTTVIISVFVLILAVSNMETAINNTPWIKPAFACVVYALFGSLGGKYVVKNIKLAALPLAIIVAFSLILGFAAPKLGIGSAYLFVGIAICAVFAILQVVREKKKAKLKEEQEHLEQIASSDVELDENSANAVKSDDEQSENQKEEQNEEQALEDAEKDAEQIAEDTESID